ncbi:myo-inositol-1-phosphate synthase [Nonomuraea thailandensis]|uniref:Myo-inositol-1-phosphate synthase n=1 Tax=Nonomuraea thailandensis TaxID=1188745 RepID=A0A9X2K927_9ACTN|nr:inositol-3-phosphate synthase [Nonomuraea thailandensis]MCP2365287.1 myo-inositol-1-phosphate synthase [Nonomuraea thailandensis]
MSSVNVAVIGVGNCVSSLVQGVEHYRDGDAPGLPNPVCAGYAISQVRFTAAFDVGRAKLGQDLSQAIWAAPNNARRFADVPHLGVPVVEGILADGVGPGSADLIDPRGAATPAEVAAHLRETGSHVVLNFLPTGAQRAAELYARAAVEAGCAFVNCMPAVLARSPEWRARFAAAGLPLIGDDLKSSFGATLVHRALVDALTGNGVRLTGGHQLLGGGNMDFVNLEDAGRMRSKQATKATGAGASIHVGAQYVPFMDDRKVAYIRLDGEGFGGSPLELELRLVVEDSPSAAGNALDAARHAKQAMDRGAGGLLEEVSGALMKAV